MYGLITGWMYSNRVIAVICLFAFSVSLSAHAPDPRYVKKPQDNPKQGSITDLCRGVWLPKKHADIELKPLSWQKFHADWCNANLAGKSPEYIANAVLSRIFTNTPFDHETGLGVSAATSKAQQSRLRHPYQLEFIILTKVEYLKLPEVMQAQLNRYEEWGTEGYAYQVVNRKITVYGKTALAHEHAVFSMFEQVFDCGYYTADAVDMPLLAKVKMTPKEWNRVLSSTQFFKQVVPKFTYREVFYGEARRGIYAQWHGLTYGESAGTFENHPGWGMWVHTLHKLLPPDKHFAEHPEYYALRNGVRMKDQVCMSSEGALKEVIAQLKIEVEKNPSALYWSVSQLDNYNYCECDLCKSVDEYEGSHSGSLLRFVNQVASVFPHKIISTLAYQYSRRPPLVTKPLPNVNIMLCTIEENRAVDLRGTSFERDLASWSVLTKNILIWDYVINFSHLLMPFPNFHILPTNMLLFQKYGVPMVFEQGYNSVGSEMQEFRCYLLSKLMWMEGNYDRDTVKHELGGQYYRPRYSDAFKKDLKFTYERFLQGYYNQAGNWVMGMLSTSIRELWESKKPLTLYEPPINHANDYLNLSLIEETLKLWSNMATRAVEVDTQLAFRFERIIQPYRYAFLEIAKYPEMTEGGLYRWRNKLDQGDSIIQHIDKQYRGLEPILGEMLNQFVQFANLHGPKLMHEIKGSPDEYKLAVQHFYQNAITVHKGVGKKLLYISTPDKNYQANAMGWRDVAIPMLSNGDALGAHTKYKYLHVLPPRWVVAGSDGQLKNIGIGKKMKVYVSNSPVSPLKSLNNNKEGVDEDSSSKTWSNSWQDEKIAVDSFVKYTRYYPFAANESNSSDDANPLADTITADLNIRSNVWYWGQPLVDGVQAGEEYQRNWQGWWGRNMEVIVDLGMVDTVRSVEIRYLENNQAWIVGPSKMTVTLFANAGDGNDYNLSEELKLNAPKSVQLSTTNPKVGLSLPVGIGTLSVDSPKPMVARYIRVLVENPGPLPKWRGVNGNGWLFVDEIKVK